MYQRVFERSSRAIQEDPTYSDAYLQRGKLLYFQRRQAEAREDMNHALALGVDDPEEHFGLAMPFQGEEARQIIRKGISLCETYPWDDRFPGKAAQHQLRFQYDQTYWSEWDLESCRVAGAEHLGWLEGLLLTETVSEGCRYDWRYSAIHTVSRFLSMSCAHLADYVGAEHALRRSLPYLDRLPWKGGESQRHVADIIRLRCEAGNFAGALAACDEFQAVLVGDDRGPWEALLTALRAAAAVSSSEDGERKKACARLLEAVVWARVHQ